MAQSTTDDELVAMCLEGRREAWETLVSRYGAYVYAIAIKAFHMPSDEAEEAFQVVFTKVYTNLEQYRGHGRFKTWLAQVARSVCIDQMRAKTRARGYGLTSDWPAEWMDGHEPVSGTATSSMDDEISRLTERVTVKQALARLPEESRRLLYLRFYKDLPYNEIARLTGRSEKVAAALTSRSLARLRQVLVDMGAAT
ncbi:MAG: sigma-70 family RNA polymerase sigma factor [Bacillota bacterium]|nr:sigma-70 family RNA polymerase sigma factor [Bacillota bacterium]